MSITTATLTTSNITTEEIIGGLKSEVLRSKYFEHFFTGDSIDAIWTQTDGAGAGTFAMQDGLNGGLRITTSATGGDRSHIHFNNIRHFDARSSTFYGIVRFQNSANGGQVYYGMSAAGDIQGASTHYYIIVLNSNSGLISIQTMDGTTATATDSDVTSSTAVVPFKIISNGTNIRFYLLVAGAWTLKVTKTTNLPTAATATQPVMQVRTGAAATLWGEALYCKVQNDT